MKKTISVNIGSMAFTLDEDAYNVLRDYLDDVRTRLPEPERGEVLQDIEARLAEILRERTPVVGQVVDLPLVRQAMAMIGDAECFGERKTQTERGYRTGPDPFYGFPDNGQEPRKLFRARYDKMIGGLCGGIARYFGWDPTLVRVAVVLLAVATFSVAFWAYLILWIVVPVEPIRLERKNERP